MDHEVKKGHKAYAGIRSQICKRRMGNGYSTDFNFSFICYVQNQNDVVLNLNLKYIYIYY